MRVKAISVIMLALLLANMLTVEVWSTKSATMTLAEQIIASLTTISNWTDNEKLQMQGIVFNKHSKSIYDAIVADAHAEGKWGRIIAYSRIAEIDGYWSELIELKLKDALNNMPFFENYSLPKNYPWPNTKHFRATQASELAGYRYARMLNTNRVGWDPVSSFESLKRMWDALEHPFTSGNPETLEIYSLFGGRWYMNGFLMESFRYLWQENVSDAWAYMNATWNYLNQILWSGTHYIYAPAVVNWEKTVYPMYMPIIKLYIENNRNLVWWNRLLADIQNRYLVDLWESPQWYIAPNKYYATVHHSPSNAGRILCGVLAAWYFLHMFYGSFNASNQVKMQDMLEGYSNEDPAWKNLLKTNSGLFVPEQNRFKDKNFYSEPTDEGTACGVLTMVLQGISPQSGRGLALPVFGPIAWSLLFAWPFSDSFNLDIDNRKLTIPVWRNSTLKFLYGSTPFNETFSETGIWECTFDQDWNSLTSKRKISGLITEDMRYEYLYPPELLGDADLNGLVEMADFYLWGENLGKTPDQCPPGVYPDFDSNGLVDMYDFYIWRENFGATVP